MCKTENEKKKLNAHCAHNNSLLALYLDREYWKIRKISLINMMCQIYWICYKFEQNCESKKKQDTKLLPITSPNINQLATNLRLNISPRLKHVATLPSEMCQKNGINLKYVL